MKKLAMCLFPLLLFAVTACATMHRENVGAVCPDQPTVSIREQGVFHLAAYAPDGTLKWEEAQAANALANEGENVILGTMFQGATIPANYYVRLYTTAATPALTSTLASLASYELATANGYNPATFSLSKNSTDWPSGTFTLASSHWEIATKTLTLTASGAIANIRWICLTTTSDNTGKLIAYAQTAADRTLTSGDSLQITYKVRLQ